MSTITHHTFTVEGILPAATYADMQAILANHPTTGEMSAKLLKENAVGVLTHLASKLGMPTITIFEHLTSGGHEGTNYAALGEAIYALVKA